MIKFSNLFFKKANPIQLPSKVEFYTKNGVKYLKRIPVKAKEDVVYLNTIHDNVDEGIHTFVTDKNYDILGYHDYYIGNGVFDGDYMEVYPKHQRKSIGELLRLASIMMFKENNLKEMILDSMSTAIPFHMKYKFKPYIPSYQQDKIRPLLQNIIFRTQESSNFNKLAKKMYSEFYSVKDENSYQESLINLITRYVLQNRRHWDDASFLYNLDLKLDDKTIKENADFYNKLFKKHDIHYRI